MKKIIYSLILLTLLFGAVGVLAQDTNLPSPGILPDSPFYFLKTWEEAIQNFFTFGAENKAKQFLHLADVRLAEYQKMIEKGKTDIAQKTLDKYQKQLNNAFQKIEELKNKGKDTTDISQKLEDTVNKHIEVLQGNLQKAPEVAKKGLQNAIENSSKVIEKAGGKTKKENSCINSGGTVTTASCCQTTSDFPNSCLIGACGCSPDNSHQVKACDCGTDKCFDGKECVAKEKTTPTLTPQEITKIWFENIVKGDWNKVFAYAIDENGNPLSQECKEGYKKFFNNWVGATIKLEIKDEVKKCTEDPECMTGTYVFPVPFPLDKVTLVYRSYQMTFPDGNGQSEDSYSSFIKINNEWKIITYCKPFLSAQ